MGVKIGLVALGCAKNMVNSEQMLFLLEQNGYEITSEVENTDVTVINTCAFIESAKMEAINDILELIQLKKEGKIGKIVVAGCMPERYRGEVLEEMPEVDALVGTGSFDDIVSAVQDVLDGKTPQYFGDISAPVSEGGRVLGSPPYTAYLKIAEGCDNACAYCIIPSIRGKYRSRPMENIVREARQLARDGAKELIVVAQDTTRYGLDLYGERRLADLLDALCGIDGVEWVRLHYMYPDEFDEKLIETIATQDKVLKYLDIPIQHISDDILSRMRRRGGKKEIEQLFARLRERIPGVVLRSSIIVGLPGETEEDFEQLCAFLKKANIERAGVFPYSQEEGTAAAKMEAQVDEETKYRRADIVMGIQEKVQNRYNEKLKGKKLTVLCEGFDRYAECYFGRSYAESPEIDGKIFFTSDKKLSPGDMPLVLITGDIDADLMGKVEEAPHT